MSEQMRPLDPAHIDEYIETVRRAGRPQNDDDARFVRALHGAYTVPAAPGAAVLERVHARLRAEMANPSAVGTATRTAGSLTRTVEPRGGAPGPRGNRPVSRIGSVFGAMAAILVVALLAGAFYAVTQGRGKKAGIGPTATARNVAPGPIGVWQDVRISSGNTGGKLDFDPSKGVSYGVAVSDGTVYACGSGHLWYSQDGGAHYSAFSPALPSSFAAQISGACTMTTVQGWPGVFIAQNATPNVHPDSALYAAPGDGSWQKLIMSGVALPAGGGGSQGQVVGGEIWADLFNSSSVESLTPAVQASGDWLYFGSGASGSYDLVATHDFGQSWVDVSAADTSGCTHFAVSPNDEYYLACQPSSAGGITESVDGGKTWTSLSAGIGGSLYLVGMSDHTIYATYTSPANTEHVVTSDVKTGTWTDRGAVHAVNVGGPETVAVDGTVYFPALDDQTATRLTVYTYTPGDQGLKQALDFTALPGGKGGIRMFGGLWPNMTPAVYSIEAPATTGPTSFYRLYLPSPSSGPVATQPTATPTATAIGDNPCTRAQGNLADIQSGGIGADFSTLASRWGGQDGAGLGSVYFGRNSDGKPKVQAPDGYSRAYGLIYNVDPGKKTAPPDATAIAQTILPTDATAMTQLQTTYDPQSGQEELQQLYCSAAYLAVAPTSQQGALPVPRNGVIRVTYLLGQVGNVQSITFWPVQ